MKLCQLCNNENLDTSRYCNECGTKLAEEPVAAPPEREGDTGYRAPETSGQFVSAQVTSIGVPPIVEPGPAGNDVDGAAGNASEPQQARLIIERGDGVNTEFPIAGDESNIGRWDADNGIFPDVDLDAYDPDAKVSRRHARIVRRGQAFFIEDLGSTNGTFINRGRRLLPGSPQVLSEGDEIIVGKTFLRFRIG